MPPALQWKTAPAPRAKPIPQEIWECYREELCALYQNYTLDNLMTMMKVNHSFSPSRRQYVSQFEKWGTHKYKVSNKDAVQPPPPSASGPRLQYKPPTDVVHKQDSTWATPMNNTASSPTKRQRSLRDSAPIPAKRQVLSDYRSPDHCVKESEDERDDTPILASVTGTSLPPEGTTPGDADPIYHSSPTESMNGFGFDNFDAAFFLENDTPQSVSTDTDKKALKVKGSEPNQNTLIHDIFSRWANRQVSDRRPKQSDALFDINRPIDTFSSEEMENIHRAADFLFALNFRKDAFPLYVLVLKRLKSRKPAGGTSSALVACVRSAVLPNQASIARSLLIHQLEQECIAKIEQFAFRLLLADTYKRFKDNIVANTHIRTALESNPYQESLIEDLPDDYRALDFITYHFVVDGINRSRIREVNEGVPFNYFSVDKNQVQDQILQRVPGPFELVNGEMRNRCIRACLDWCATILESRTIIPGLWDIAQPSNDSQLNEDKSDHTRLYCYLWQRWQTAPLSQFGQDLEIWTQAEILIGISAAEHLILCCPMILKSAPARTDYSEGARKGINILRMKTDEDIAFKYLDAFHTRNKRLLNTDGDEILALSIPAEGCEPADKSKRLSIKLAYTPQAPEAETVVAKTMASSMASSDLSSFRKLRDRIRRKMQKADTATKRSSRITDHSMDQLSHSMASSLSLSSLPTRYKQDQYDGI
ncbi:hypothetical protein BJ878DRAFT_225335 [Calycina marina]|uniref:Clr5 domain-containing protein n=1 Tax=Calycina marina TaxID=1763456 RepID=A0A9P7YXE6_9HELO|nr:hypothetical protein BJ878DRAFT_225335 [Calycina marina]